MDTRYILCFSMLVAYATASQHIAVGDAMAARVDAQAWRADRLTEQFQAISDKADAVNAAAKAAGGTARHLMKIADGTSIRQVVTWYLVHEPDNIRASSGWAKECCYFLISIIQVCAH